jgi:hypothetical protein
VHRAAALGVVQLATAYAHAQQVLAQRRRAPRVGRCPKKRRLTLLPRPRDEDAQRSGAIDLSIGT